MRPIMVTVNGIRVAAEVEPRRLLSDFLRDDLCLTGTHVGCEHGVCGACTVLIDGRAARSCLTFAVQCDGAEVTTIEGLTPAEGLNPIQQAFHEHHALQCGFCTPGFVVSVHAFLQEHPAPAEAEIRAALSGNLCRCTGYQNIITAVKQAAAAMAGTSQAGAAPAGAPATTATPAGAPATTATPAGTTAAPEGGERP